MTQHQPCMKMFHYKPSRYTHVNYNPTQPKATTLLRLMSMLPQVTLLKIRKAISGVTSKAT